MNATLSIMDIPAHNGERVIRTRPSCWCGQDLQYVDRSHCPRCGRSGSRWAGR